MMPGRDEGTGALIEPRNSPSKCLNLAATIRHRLQSNTQLWVRLNEASHTRVEHPRQIVQRLVTAFVKRPAADRLADRFQSFVAGCRTERDPKNVFTKGTFHLHTPFSSTSTSPSSIHSRTS